MKIIVCGSRGYVDRARIRERLMELPADSEIMHGDARGADRIAGSVANELSMDVWVYPAPWSQGRQAGVVRNLVMLAQHPDLVLAFWDGESPGTKHMITAARKRGIPVEVIS